MRHQVVGSGRTGHRSEHLRLRQAAATVVEALERRSLLSVTVEAATDADVQSLVSNPTVVGANFGADPQLRVNADPANRAEAYLTFDLGGVSGIGSAILRLHGGRTVASDTPLLVGAFPVPDTSWVEGDGTHTGTPDTDNSPAGEIRWNNRPSTSGGSLDAVHVTATGDYYLNVTSYLKQEKQAGHNRVSLSLKNVGGGAGEVTFDSREAGGTGPALVIEPNANGPKASFTSPNLTAPATTQVITATYADPDGVNLQSIDPTDIQVARAGGPPLTVLSADVTDGSNPTAVMVNYTIQGPGGQWDAADNALYTTLLNDAAVTDAKGNPAVGGPDSFFASIGTAPGTTDTTPPAAQVTAPDVTAAGTPTGAFTVTYSDNASINASTIDVGDATVARPGSPALRITGVTVSPSTNGSPLVATYTFAAPGGSWSASDNGTYQVQVKAGAAADLAGNLTPAATKTFEVRVPDTQPQPGDTAPPTAAVATLPPITEAGVPTQMVQVTYTDETAVDVGSIDSGDVTVTRGGTTLPVVAVSANPPADGKIVTAIYTVAAPRGSFGSEDSGSYSIAVKAGAVTDTAGNAVAAATGGFDVAVPGPKPPLDTSFGGGTVTSGFVAEAAATQPDGRVLVAGRQGDLSAGTSEAVLQRLNPDGSLDGSFGSGGKVTVSGANDAYFAIELAADGGILVAGTSGGDFAVSKYRSNGSLDRRFGSGGRATSNFGATDVAYALALAPDGSVVAGGSSGDGSGSTFAFTRYHDDGKPDVFFGEQGRSRFDMGDGGNVVSGVAVQPDGKVIGAGSAGGTTSVVRLNTDGNADTGFGTNGALMIGALTTRQDLGEPDHTVGLALQGDGKVLVSNRTGGTSGGSGNFAVARVTTDGKLDTTFGDNGIVTADFGGDDDADALVVQGTGEILAVGTTDAGGTPQVAVAAFGRDGTPDGNFGTGGKFTTDAGVSANSATGRALHTGDLLLRAFGNVGADGRLVVGTSTTAPAATSGSGLRRLNVPGSGLVGRFGQLGRRNAKIAFVDADGTAVTVTLKGGGTGQVFSDGTHIDLVLSGSAGGSSVSIKARGGDGRVTLRNVQGDGGLKAFSAKAADLTGTFSSGGDVGKVALGTVTGTFATAGSIQAVTLSGDLNAGRILAGAKLGSDGLSGGDGSAADTFTAATIGAVNVKGSANAALVTAGVDPRNGVFLDADDQVVGGAASVVRSVLVKGAVDPSTRFVAGGFGRARVPQTIDPGADPRFQVL